MSQTTPPPMRVTEILETCLYASDLAAAERFYGDVLGLERITAVAGRHVFFRCGAGVFLVFDPAATLSGEHVPAHGATGAGHVAFAVAGAALEGWRAHLEGLGVAIEREVEWPKGGRSLYLRDPAGNSVELATPAIWGITEAAALGA